jgi:hypothetical protein
MTTFLLVLLGIETVALVSVIVMYRKAKKASRNRRVEAPNSSYKSQYVVDLEAKERWEKVDLSLLHEVNREEFEKLLAKVRATSVKALPTHERAFLDRMSDAHDIVLAESRKKNDAPPGTRHAPGS